MPIGIGAATLGSGLIGAVSSLLGGSKTAKGIAEANRQNIQLAKDQMAFQERMSSTAYQRAATDIQAAGLNRILALGKPASSPAGQTARVENVEAPKGAAIAAAGGQAMTTARQIAEIKNIEANTKKTEADTLLSETTEKLRGYGADIASWGAGIVQTVEAMLGNKTPAEKAAWINKRISEASKWLTDTAEGITNALEAKNMIEQVRQSLLDTIAPGADYDPNRKEPQNKILETKYERYKRETKGEDISYANWIRRNRKNK